MTDPRATALDATAKHELLAELCSSGEALHGAPDDRRNWGLGEGALELILAGVGPGDSTLETGCGYSSIVFAMTGATHTVVSPSEVEHDRIRTWCADHGVSVDRVTFIAAHSQAVLPHLGDEPLDFVLIDGSHAFPVPFVDWYYGADRLRVGGRLMIDDTHLRTGKILLDFLRADSPRWRFIAEIARRGHPPTTALFEKTGEILVPESDWCGQPYCAGTPPSRWERYWERFKARVRVRTRLRAAARRLARPLRNG